MAGGWCANRALPWVGNLGPDHCAGLLAGVDDAEAPAATEVMFLLRCDAPGVELRNCPGFSALEGTNTWPLRCADLFVPDADAIAHPAKPLIARIRAGFILLQCGFGPGVPRARSTRCGGWSPRRAR